MREVWITVLPFPPKPKKKMALTEKITHSTAKRALTRCRSVLTNLIMRRAKDSELLAVRDTLVECFTNLEKAHNKYLASAEIDVDLDENVEEASYLAQPLQEVTDTHMGILNFEKS